MHQKKRGDEYLSKISSNLKKEKEFYLDHAVTVGIGDVRLQACKQGSVVMFEVKVLQSKFGVFNCDLNKDVVHVRNLNLQIKIQKETLVVKILPFCIFSAPCRGVAPHHAQLVIRGPGCNYHNLVPHL